MHANRTYVGAVVLTQTTFICFGRRIGGLDPWGVNPFLTEGLWKPLQGPIDSVAATPRDMQSAVAFPQRASLAQRQAAPPQPVVSERPGPPPQPVPQTNHPRRASNPAAALGVELLSQSQLQASLAHQLRMSSKSAAVAAVGGGATPGAARRRRLEEREAAVRKAAARAWITPWLNAQRLRRSELVQGALMRSSGSFSEEEMGRGLAWLLAGSTGGTGGGGARSTPGGGAAANSRARPAAEFEDGSLLFTSEVLQTVALEDLLTA